MLNSDERKYRQLVAVRIGEILELSKVSDWRWVPSKMNVADLATRKIIHDLRFDTPWFSGPAFLSEPEINWPVNKNKHLVKEEIRTQYLTEQVNFHIEATVNTHGMSDWRRVRRSQAFVLRFINNCKVKCGLSTGVLQKGPLIRCEYIAAQNCLFKRCQEESFPEEVSCLRMSPPMSLPKSSTIYKDSPFMDASGVIRSNSRLSNAIDIPANLRWPIILPKKHDITLLIINHYHRKYHHVNNEIAVNEMRQLYVVPSLRVQLKSAIFNCQYCKNKRAKPKTPFMANLPEARLASFTRPFSFIGIDFKVP